MDIPPVVLIGIVLIIGAAIQSAAGFAFGMFAIPLIMMIGRTPAEAISMIATCGLIQTLIGLWSHRQALNLRMAAWMVGCAGVAMPLGVWTLGQIEAFGRERVQQIFGAIVLSLLIVQWTVRVTPRERLHAGWGVLANAASGFMGGLCGMGGPPVVMWVMAHDWSTERSRVALWALFAGMTPLQILFLTQRFGMGVAQSAGEAILLSPLMLLGIFPGFWIGRRMTRAQLRVVSYLILATISVIAIVRPWIRLTPRGLG